MGFVNKFARIGKVFGAPGDDPLDGCRYLVESLYAWLDRLPIPRLGQFGLTKDHVGPLVSMASNKNNPLPLSAGQIEKMIRSRC